MTDQEFKEFLEKLKVSANDVDLNDFEWSDDEIAPSKKFDRFCEIKDKLIQLNNALNGSISIKRYRGNVEVMIFCEELYFNDALSNSKELFGEIYDFSNAFEVLPPQRIGGKIEIDFVFGQIFEKIYK